MMDHHLNVIYHNEQAQSYCRELTGDDPQHFKYFFINQIKPRVFQNYNAREDVLELPGFRVKVCQRSAGPESGLNKGQVLLFVYIIKTMLEPVLPPTAAQVLGSLSKREREIVSLIRSGLTYQQIANKLSISPYTVKTHMQRIYKKTGASNKTTLLFQLSKEGLE